MVVGSSGTVPAQVSLLDSGRHLKSYQRPRGDGDPCPGVKLPPPVPIPDPFVQEAQVMSQALIFEKAFQGRNIIVPTYNMGLQMS